MVIRTHTAYLISMQSKLVQSGIRRATDIQKQQKMNLKDTTTDHIV